MCMCSVLHHHHIPPCARPRTLVTHYLYCGDAAVSARTNEVLAPCANVRYTGGPGPGPGPLAPCAPGGCVVSPQCATGTCRLLDLGGRWVCCVCKRGGNGFRTCTNRKFGCPDTFCYHDICQRCTADAAPPTKRG